MRANLANVQISLAVLLWLTPALGAARGSEFFAAFLYFFAWWPLLLFLDGLLLRLTGESWLWDRPWDFLHLAFTSVTIWLVFELFNFRLLNWRYVGLEPLLPVRWAGYALAFATVLPGILLASQVLAALGAWRRVKGRPCSLGSWQTLFLVLGAACLVYFGWEVWPDALHDLVLRVTRDYDRPVIEITENGCSNADAAGEDGVIRDLRRIQFHRGYLAALHRAIRAGADVRGYHAWTLLDNFEWAAGFGQRFGLAWTDFTTCDRTLKQSGEWYGRIAAENGFDPEAERTAL